GGGCGVGEGGLSCSSQSGELAALRRCYRWARCEGLRQDDRTEGIGPPGREPCARARGLSAEEVARLLAVIPADSAAGLRLRALVLAYLLTGRRRSEVLNPALAGPGPGGRLLPLHRQGWQGAPAGPAASGPAGHPG